MKLSKLYKPSLNQRGDTLVEVLICVLIVTVVLTGAYVTTSKSIQGVRNSQEHTEALKLVQSQLELLRQDAGKTTGAKVFSIVPPFCMLNDGATRGAFSTTSAPGQAMCVQNSSGKATDAEPAYTLTVGRQNCSAVSADCYAFSVKATWNSVTGSVTSEQITYRLYK